MPNYLEDICTRMLASTNRMLAASKSSVSCKDHSPTLSPSKSRAKGGGILILGYNVIFASKPWDEGGYENLLLFDTFAQNFL